MFTIGHDYYNKCTNMMASYQLIIPISPIDIILKYIWTVRHDSPHAIYACCKGRECSDIERDSGFKKRTMSHQEVLGHDLTGKFGIKI